MHQYLISGKSQINLVTFNNTDEIIIICTNKYRPIRKIRHCMRDGHTPDNLVE
jgi:hypothetical protein